MSRNMSQLLLLLLLLCVALTPNGRVTASSAIF